MHDIMLKLNARDVLRYVIAYVFWLLAGLIGLLVLFVARAALNALWPAMGFSRWLLRSFDQFSLVLMGLLWLVYVIFCEDYYRTSITKVRIRRMKAEINATVRAENARESKLTKALARLGLDVLARRLVPTLGIPLILLVLAYLVYRISWIIMFG
jgi:hypothetical protein